MKFDNFPSQPRKLLTSTALGKKKADLVIENSTLINVYSGELLEDRDVAVKGNRITFVGEASHTVGEDTKVIDAEGKYLSPGFLDAHVHIDDSMATVTEFARVVLAKGTTGVFMDPHEIANVLGLDGVKLMVEESRNVPLRVFLSVPSCVPATSQEFETTGGSLGIEEIREALEWKETVALGEMMSFSGIIGGEEEPHEMVQEALRRKKLVEGHAPGLLGRDLNAYIAAGITSCHESTEEEEALQKLRLGMYPMIREGFTSLKNLSDLIGIITERRVNPSRVCLATDDRHPEDLVNEGHMDNVIKRTIGEGVDPVEAIRMGSLSTAEHFKVDEFLGGISPGKFADMVILENLSTIEVSEVIAGGDIVFHDGDLSVEFDSFDYPQYAKETVRLPRKVRPEDFEIYTSSNREKAEARIIGIREKTPKTESLVKTLPVEDGVFQVSLKRDVTKVGVVERHKGTGNIGLGFVTGFGFERGATASTISHDSHNVIVIGTNDRDMALAVNKLAEVGGGIIAVKDEEVLGLVKLPIAGLMSDKPLEETSKKLEGIRKSWRELGCDLETPLPTITLLVLPVLPELRITDKGLIDTINFEMIAVEAG